MIGAVLERKAWVHTLGSNLYPNLYVILVAPPGVGKTVLTSVIQKFWHELPEHKIAPSSVSRASLTDALVEAQRSIVRPQEIPSVVQFNSLYVASNELQVFLPIYDGEFMAVLTDLYDCKYYSEKKRSSKLDLTIANPQLSLISATTPSSLQTLLPEGAWEQGFMSRTILVFNGELIRRSLFNSEASDDTKFKDLIHDLKIISSMYGKMKFTPEAAAAIDAWHMKGGEPAPDAPRLKNYVTRRTAHLLKLCMIASAASRDDYIIDVGELTLGLSWLVEAERDLPDMFKAITGKGDISIIDDVHYWTIKIFAIEKKPVSEARVYEYLSARMPAFAIEKLLQTMVKAGLFSKELDGYKPRPYKAL